MKVSEEGMYWIAVRRKEMREGERYLVKERGKRRKERKRQKIWREVV